MSTTTLLVHGAGSCPATARRLLEPIVAPGSRVVAVRARGSIEDVVAAVDDAAGLVAAGGGRLVAAGGLSLGAHALALWAARTASTVDLVLAMPAWTGEPGPVAALTAAAATAVSASGIAAEIARLHRDPATADDWVLDELARGWSTYDDDELVTALRAASRSRGPTPAELASVLGRTAVVALADDPLHPAQVARAWAGWIPGAAYAEVARRAPDADRGALGRAGAGALATRRTSAG